MYPKIDKIVIFPISAFVIILITVFLTIFIDPIESNFAIYLNLSELPMYFVYFFFLFSLIMFFYGIWLIFKGIRSYNKNLNNIILRTKSSGTWYLGGKIQLFSLILFWIGLFIHNYFVIVLYEYIFLESFFPNFSNFLISFVFIISPILSFILLLIGNKINKKAHENEKKIKSELFHNSQWIKDQYLIKNRPIQEIADELGIPMVEIKKEIAKAEK